MPWRTASLQRGSKVATKKRATLGDRAAKKPDTQKGRGVDALFDAAKEEPAQPQRRRTGRRSQAKETPITATFNLYPQHQDFLDSFVREGKQQFRKRGVGVGAINKSAVLQELLELLKGDDAMKEKIVQSLERQGREEASRHDPRKRRG